MTEVFIHVYKLPNYWHSAHFSSYKVVYHHYSYFVNDKWDKMTYYKERRMSASLNDSPLPLEPGARLVQHAPVRAARVRRPDDGLGGRLSQHHGPLPHKRHLLLQRDQRPLALLWVSQLLGQGVPDQARRVQEVQRVGRPERQGWLHQTHHGLLICFRRLNGCFGQKSSCSDKHLRDH